MTDLRHYVLSEPNFDILDFRLNKFIFQPTEDKSNLYNGWEKANVHFVFAVKYPILILRITLFTHDFFN